MKSLIQGFTCDKCGHVWVSTKYNHTNLPPICSRCKSIYWNTVKVDRTNTYNVSIADYNEGS